MVDKTDKADTNEPIKYFRREIELPNWKMRISKKGKGVTWEGTMDDATTDEIIEFLFERHGKVSEYKTPPTFIVPPVKQNKSVEEKPKQDSSEKWIHQKKRLRIQKVFLTKIFKVLDKCNLGIIYQGAEPKKREGSNYWELMTEADFLTIMESYDVFKRFEISIKQKPSNL
jgi:hypothetical protein